MNKIKVKVTSLFVLLTLIAAAYFYGGEFHIQKVRDGFKISFPSMEYPSKAYVKRVIDGDTVVLANEQRLRYIGIDTPELKHPNAKVRDLAETAKKINDSLVNGEEILLEYDVERKDKYGRLLAYVYLRDGTFVNAELVKEGYASIMTIPPNVKYADFFLKLQKEARKTKQGLWRENSK